MRVIYSGYDALGQYGARHKYTICCDQFNIQYPNDMVFGHGSNESDAIDDLNLTLKLFIK